MVNPLAAFPDNRVPKVLGYMCKSSVYSCVPRKSVTSNFLKGLMVVPLMARGVRVDGRKLSGCLWSYSKTGPLMLMSAPKSGRVSIVTCFLREDM